MTGSQNGMRIITQASLSYFKRLNYGSRLLFKKFFILKQIETIQNSLFDPNYSRTGLVKHFRNQYAELQLYNGSKESSMCQWNIVTDQQFGGGSKAELGFDGQSLIIKGNIDTKDSYRMISYPFFGISTRHQISFKLGPFQIIQLYAKTDGQAVTVEINLQSSLNGNFLSSANIISKSKDWQYYQIPIPNMTLYQNDAPKQNYQMKNLIQQADDYSKIKAYKISIKIKSTKQKQRNFWLKSIKLIRRIGFNQLIKDYRKPYFFITNGQKQIDLSIVNIIDTGNIKYFRK